MSLETRHGNIEEKLYEISGMTTGKEQMLKH